MAPENIPVAVSPFGQVESVMARSYPGTGLGLPLAKRLVELMGRQFRVDSALGQGTTVTIELPSKPAAKPEKVEAAAA